MERWAGRVALVTGASAGIGQAVARRLVQQGMTVIGCARNIAKIQELSESLKSEKGRLLSYQCDITKEDQVLGMFAMIRDKYGGVDVCINNAGLAFPDTLLAGRTERWRYMFEVNVLGLCVCTREAVKSMRGRNVDDGHIINISSLAGHFVQGMDEIDFYSATKSAVNSLTMGLRKELRRLKSSIGITSVCPGEVVTEFAYRFMPGHKEAIDAMHSNDKLLKSDDVADSVLFVLATPAHNEIQTVWLRGKL